MIVVAVLGIMLGVFGVTAIVSWLRDILRTLEQILAAIEPFRAVKIVFETNLEGHITKGALNLEMTNSQKATITIAIVDKAGAPAPVDGVPAWATSDATIITVTPAADGMSAEVVAVGPLGKANVSVTADADLGTGVKSIFGILEVEITQGEAVGITLTLGEPTEQ